MNRINLFVILISMVSCRDSGFAHFEITNNTNRPIDSLQVLPDKNTRVLSILPGETREYISDMRGGAKTDGEYMLKFKTDSVVRTKRFGYYTNGYPIEESTKINIKADTILFDYILD